MNVQYFLKDSYAGITIDVVGMPGGKPGVLHER